MDSYLNRIGIAPHANGSLPTAAASLATDALLMRAVANALNVKPAGQASGLATWRLKRVARYIDENISRPISVADLAAAAKLSPSHLSRSFRISIGIAPHAYLIVHRMALARALLVSTSRPLLEIALECGLADQAHLCRLFRRHVGMSPSAWRREAVASARRVAAPPARRPITVPYERVLVPSAEQHSI